MNLQRLPISTFICGKRENLNRFAIEYVALV